MSLSVRITLLALAVAAILGIGSYFFLHTTTKPSTTIASTFTITTSFYPLYFFTTHIVGDKATVYNLTPAGAEPHDYEPTTDDLIHLEQSRLVVLNGGHLEAWGDKVSSIVDTNKTTIVTAGDGLISRSLNEDGAVGPDPHVWLDPQLAAREVAVIAAAVEKVDPDNAAYYSDQATTLLQQLAALDNDYRTGLTTCVNHSFVTSHAAFGYLADEYGLTQVAIAGLSPDEEPSPKKLADVATFVKTNNIKTIFFESLVSPKLAETIANETGANTMVLNPIEGLTPDDLAHGKNYFTEMQNNLTNLKTVLLCP